MKVHVTLQQKLSEKLLEREGEMVGAQFFI
jgi:hypothetical protein